MLALFLSMQLGNEHRFLSLFVHRCLSFLWVFLGRLAAL